MSSALVTAVEQVKHWMLEHDAGLLVANLAPGAAPETLAALELQFGFALPEDVKALWSLHHGQREEMNGFVEAMDLFDGALALGERDTVEAALEALHEAPQLPQTGLTPAELVSKQWVPFAGRDSNLLVVNAESGRVFVLEKDWPPIRFLADSVTAWAQGYAAAVMNDDFTVEEGFGDYFLSARDREAESYEIERERVRARQERYRRETPLLEQLRDALDDNREALAREVIEAFSKASPADLPRAVEVLFSSTSDVKFIATALQYVLRTVTLDAAQWAKVLEGGRALGNEAIVGVAKERAP